MKKKWLSASMLLLALTLVLSACGGSKNSSDDGKTAAGGGSSSGGSGDKVTIKMMHLWPDGSNSAQNKLAKQIISEYEQANPNVKIETEVLENEQYKNKLKVLSASNSLPDVGFTWAAGFLEPYV
ncbi:ABC transporter substrate-binding protein, partial [Paenibacillus sp. AR247]